MTLCGDDALAIVRDRLCWGNWWLAASATSLGGVLVWYFVAPVVGRLLGLWHRGDLIRVATRIATALLLSAVIFRITAPRDSSWFADFGDYFNPALTLTWLMVVGITLHLQVATVDAAQKQLAEAQRQLSLSRVPVVLVRQIYLRQNQLMMTLECGGETAINVVLQAIGGNGDVVGYLRYSALFPSVATTAVAGVMAGASASIDLRVSWQNVHGAQFAYDAEATPADSGTWNVPTEVVFATPVVGSTLSNVT